MKAMRDRWVCTKPNVQLPGAGFSKLRITMMYVHGNVAI